VTDAVDVARCDPATDLLADRDPNEAYALADPGRAYAVLFPADEGEGEGDDGEDSESGGDGDSEVTLDLADAAGTLDLRWYDATFGDDVADAATGPEGVTPDREAAATGGDATTLAPPGDGRWVAVLT
jgi:hypothetical protein